MASLDLNDCECDERTRYTNLQHIVLMFSCARCGGVDKITVLDVDGAINALTKLRATAFHGRVTAEGAERADRPAG